MNAYPFTRKFIWLSGLLGILSTPIFTVLPKGFGTLNLFIWPFLPISISALLAFLYCKRNGWHIESELLFKGGNRRDALNLKNLEWVMFGRPLTEVNRKRYVLTKGSTRYKYWKTVDNTVCMKSKCGQYLMLDIHFYNNSKRFLNILRNSICSRELKMSELNDKEMRSLKFGHSNHVFRL